MFTHYASYRSFVVLIIVAAVFAFAGCATNITPTAVTNPPPTEAWSAFQRFEVKPIAMTAPYSGQEANEAALKKIQQNFDLRVNPLVEGWNAKAGADAAGRTLVIEPRIQDIKFINATARVWGGAFSGNSAVILKIRFIDKATGTVVAEPEFYQHAAAMGGAWSFGATDNNMLVRIASVASDYVAANYEKPVGGRTGAAEKTE